MKKPKMRRAKDEVMVAEGLKGYNSRR